MRYREIMPETGQPRPSDRFLLAVRSWADNTMRDRIRKENALLACREEAAYFLRASYPRLYRGQPLTGEQLTELHAGGAITIDLPRLSSWTLKRRVAETFAEFGDSEYSAVLAIPGKLVTPILDCSRIIKFFPQTGTDAEVSNTDLLSDMAREHEVVVYHDGHLSITPALVAVVFEPDHTGRIVRRSPISR